MLQRAPKLHQISRSTNLETPAQNDAMSPGQIWNEAALGLFRRRIDDLSSRADQTSIASGRPSTNCGRCSRSKSRASPIRRRALIGMEDPPVKSRAAMASR